MSFELPEALILAKPMSKELRGKQIKSYHLQDYKRVQRPGFINMIRDVLKNSSTERSSLSHLRARIVVSDDP